MDADCTTGEYCSAVGCVSGCSSDEGCLVDEYCDVTVHQCKTGCRGEEECGTCGKCLNHSCKEPDCCQDSDCGVRIYNDKKIKSIN